MSTKSKNRHNYRIVKKEDGDINSIGELKVGFTAHGTTL